MEHKELLVRIGHDHIKHSKNPARTVTTCCYFVFTDTYSSCMHLIGCILSCMFLHLTLTLLFLILDGSGWGCVLCSGLRALVSYVIKQVSSASQTEHKKQPGYKVWKGHVCVFMCVCRGEGVLQKQSCETSFLVKKAAWNLVKEDLYVSKPGYPLAFARTILSLPVSHVTLK